ncbi:MAG TPA: hypothetical protein VIG33_05765 [Pseudobdellovibrionaceae bacterium]|jgi:hypothetical protein
MNALNRSSQLFARLMVFNGSILFSMSLQRLVLFLVVIRHWVFGVDGLTIGTSFINGVRFDLCVLGFLNIPVLFFTWAVSTDFIANTQNKVLQFLQQWMLWIYLTMTTLIIHVLGLLDLMFFAANGHRWTYYDWQESGLSFFGKMWSAWGVFFTFGVIFLFLILWTSRSLFTLYKLKLQGELLARLPLMKGRLSTSKSALIAVGFLLPLFVVALAARGTWTPHHINKEHAEVSQIQALNQMTLSPIWAFDKKF